MIANMIKNTIAGLLRFEVSPTNAETARRAGFLLDLFDAYEATCARQLRTLHMTSMSRKAIAKPDHVTDHVTDRAAQALVRETEE